MCLFGWDSTTKKLGPNILFLILVETGCIRPFLMVPRKTKNEKICWALIGSKVFVFRFSEGPNHALHGNTKTKNENQSTVGQCRSAAVQIEQPSINLLLLQIGASFFSAIMSIARGFGYWFACESYSGSIRTSTKFELTHLRVLWRLRRTPAVSIHILAFCTYLRSRSSRLNMWLLLQLRRSIIRKLI